MLETLDYTIRIGSTPTFLYFDLYLYSAYAAHYVYFTFRSFTFVSFTGAATLCLISRGFATVSLLYKFTRFFIYFLFLSDEGPMLERVRLYYPYCHLYFDSYIYSIPNSSSCFPCRRAVIVDRI